MARKVWQSIAEQRYSILPELFGEPLRRVNRSIVVDRKPTVYEELEQAIDLLKTHFLALKGNDIDEVKMARRALSAMLGTLGDTFTNYIPPSQFDTYRSRKQQQVVGIGLQVELDNESRVRVVAPLGGSPTDIPRIQTGYELVEIDDTTLHGLDNAAVGRLMQGPEGSSVRLRLRTPHNTDICVTVARRAVDVDYIGWSSPADHVAMARVAWFSGTGHTAFIENLTSRIAQGVRGLILDLRSNSGGSIIATRNIFSSLCDAEIMYLGKKRDEDNIPDRILGEHRFDLPLVVLINEHTFSAGEVLAGALKDHGRATIVGVRSGGKGSMQQVFPLEGQIGGALRITTAANCTPGGQVVQDNGIAPDIEVALPYPELFVADGPQNISLRGREYLQDLRLEKLRAAARGSEAATEVEAANTAGDMQLARGLIAIEELLNS